ncbi:four-carbon acid sugar kinase family protein [Pseudonocardia sp. CA-107938]|uniref:four-carbon acid sugar kinase family protein n=1 Tax=Pseudonocardia sp. CA-107938 TaxID=3240021 RepID=UPI003D9149CB
MNESELLASYPPEVEIPAGEVAASVAASGRTLVVLDDDPTGTQSVSELPVLTRWARADFEWAFAQHAPAVYVLTNTRSLGPAEAQARNREVVRNALSAAGGAALAFVSRSDSTLRGHFPLEPEVIADELAQASGARTDAVVIVPAFPDAGRVTIGGTHYMRDGAGGLVPVAETEFARDATFGFTRSRLAEYVEEKSGGRYPARDVIVLDLHVIRGGAGAIADALDGATGGVPAVADVVTENDLRALALGLAEAERRGKNLLYRVGPPFVRGRIGQEVRAPLTAAEAFGGRPPADGGGLVVIGSHVGLTTRQFDVLRAEHPRARVVELRVDDLLCGTGDSLDPVVADVIAGLEQGDVVLHTSRTLVTGDSPDESLGIARTVSAALVAVVRRTLDRHPPRFVVAKGGITSSDVASEGLQIRHAIVRGPMLPGIVSLWEPVGGPAAGIPYVVFPGNVGDDRSLLDVVRVLTSVRA